MSAVFDSFPQRHSQQQRSQFALPQCDNQIEEAEFEPNIISQQQFEKPEISIDKMGENSKNLDYSLQEIGQASLMATKQYTWGQGGLKVMYYITKLVKSLKNLSPLIKFKPLNTEILELISDSASDPQVLLKQTTSSRLVVQYIQRSINFIPVIEPDSSLKMLWKICVLMLIMMNIFYLPIKLGFDLQNEGLFSSIFFGQLPSWIFIMDIILNFFSAYYSQGQIHRRKEEIFRNYARTTLWWDLIIAISFILSSFNVSYTEYILLLRVTKVKVMIESIEEVINPSFIVQTIIELFKSVFLVIFVSHCCACLWNLIGQMEMNQNLYSWLEQKNISDATWQSRYIHSLYFSTITTLTVGYGDIVPVTDVERIFVILMAMVICGLFGYTISSIGNILRQLTEKEQHFKQKMMSINNYLKKRQVNKFLMLQVRKYFEYYLKMKYEDNEQGEEMMKNLSKQLKQQVAIDLYFKMLMKSRLIRQTLSSKSVEKLCCLVKEKKYAPEEVISYQYEQADKLVFLQRGQINLICNMGVVDKKLVAITQGRYIGEKEFIVQGRYDYTIRTTKFCQIAYVNYEDFHRIIKEDALEEENYSMLKDQMLFNPEKKNYGEVCYICKWTHHFKKYNIKLIRCPLVFVQINLDRIKQQFMVQKNNLRQYSKRRQKQKFKLCLIQETAIVNIINNNIIPIEDLTDQYLVILGFPWHSTQNTQIVKTLLSMKSAFSNKSGSSSEDDQKSMISKKSKNQGNQFDQKKVAFIHTHDIEAPLTKQSFVQRKTFSRLTQIQGHRISNVSVVASDLSGLSQQFQSSLSSKNHKKVTQVNNSTSINRQESLVASLKNKSQSKSDQGSNILSNLQEEILFSNSLAQSNSRLRIDFDIDKYFTSKIYFNSDNLETVLMKVKKPQRTQRQVQIQNLLSQTKIRQNQRSQVQEAFL